MTECKYYLVCTTHRTGSNLLTQNLRQTGIAGHPTEHFSLSHGPKIAKKRGYTEPEVSLTRYINDLKSNAVTPNGVFGTKIMWSHLGVMRDQWKKDPEWNEEVSDDLWAPIRHFFPDARVIWLRRRDKLRQAISMARAKQTRIYSSMHLHTGSRVASRKPEYNFKLIYDNLRRLTKNDAAWGRLFEQVGVTPIAVEYEEMCQNPKKSALELVQQMRLNGTVEWEEVEHAQVRLSDTINDEWHDLYRAEEAMKAAALEKAREERRLFRYYQTKWERNQKTFLGRCKNQINHYLGKEPPRWKPGMTAPPKAKPQA